MAHTPPAALLYFDARGRAQFVRYYFRARDVQYEDERVPLTPGYPEWIAMRGDRTRVGPFAKLPVLRWGEQLVGETFVIYAFLHRALGDEALLSAEENLRHSMLVSTLYIDVMVEVALLLWAEVSHPGVDLAALAKRACDRLRSRCGYLDLTLGEWDWVARSRSRPVMLADAMLWEELDIVQHVFGEHLPLNNYPVLAKVYREGPGRASFDAVLRAQPLAITGRGLSAEGQAVDKIRRVLSA
jgi:hypothetical protein